MTAGESSHYETIHDLKYKLQSSDPINIQYTSGTTGTPKGVVLSHHNILNNAHHAAISQNYHLKKTIICLLVPLYHCFGMVLGSLAAICHGMTSIIQIFIMLYRLSHTNSCY
jgi:acyl-CoA synthetase (AMP-forming)/AMP-acid ligase II